jgi:hypothetical protein
VVSSRVTNIIAITVTMVWVANFLARIFVSGYSPSPGVDAAMTLVIGGAVTNSILRKKNGG